MGAKFIRKVVIAGRDVNNMDSIFLGEKFLEEMNFPVAAWLLTGKPKNAAGGEGRATADPDGWGRRFSGLLRRVFALQEGLQHLEQRDRTFLGRVVAAARDNHQLGVRNRLVEPLAESQGNNVVFRPPDY